MHDWGRGGGQAEIFREARMDLKMQWIPTDSPEYKEKQKWSRKNCQSNRQQHGERLHVFPDIQEYPSFTTSYFTLTDVLCAKPLMNLYWIQNKVVVVVSSEESIFKKKTSVEGGTSHKNT